jgi:hypothetical protein
MLPQPEPVPEPELTQRLFALTHFVRPHQSLRVELGQAVERGGKRLPNGIATEPRQWRSD